MKPGRNDPCPCGSGKKYKKCCYLAEQNMPVKNFIKSQGIQDDEDNYDEDMDDDLYNEQKLFIGAINNIRKHLLRDKPHIKKYYKIRNMYGEIVNTMVQYYQDGKFKKQIDNTSDSETKREISVHLLEADFDLDTEIGAQSFYDIWIYKTASNVTCITDDFIRDHRYRKPEKIELLHSMLDSKLGLFEVTGTNIHEGYAYLKDVFTGAEYTLIDIGLSGNTNFDKHYLYTRIISHQNVSFNTGLNFIFAKTDDFIRNHIQQHRKDFNKNGEFLRFTQLCNHYSRNSDKVRVVVNNL